MLLVLVAFFSGTALANHGNLHPNCKMGEAAVTTTASGTYVAKISGECNIVLNSSGSISQLKQNLMKAVYHDNTQVHYGPEAETYRGLEGVRFDATKKSVEDGHEITMRRNVYLVSNQSNQLFYTFDSTRIDASGNAGYLKHAFFEQEVTKIKENVFRLKTTQILTLDKPGIAPGFIFSSTLKKTVEKSFAGDLNQDFAKMTAYLR